MATSKTSPSNQRAAKRRNADEPPDPVVAARLLPAERDAFHAIAAAVNKKPGALLREMIQTCIANSEIGQQWLEQALPVSAREFELKMFKEFAKSFNREPGFLLRQLVESHIFEVMSDGSIRSQARMERDAEVELEVVDFRLPKFLLREVRSRADTEGMKTAQWISLLIQSVLMNAPVLTDKEIEVVSWANRELAAVGRNLNQIARSMNRAELVGENFKKDEVLTLEGIREVDAKIKKLRAMLLRLVAARHRAWGVKDDPAS